MQRDVGINSYLHKIRPFSVELGMNHNFRRAGDSNCTKKPSECPCFHFLDPCPFHTCMAFDPKPSMVKK